MWTNKAGDMKAVGVPDALHTALLQFTPILMD
jgi:hypothetical protein